VNPVTALARAPNGALGGDPGRETARRAAPVGRVARTGADLVPEEPAAGLTSVAEATGPHLSSMRQDVEAGRRSGVDAIDGAVVDRADESVPVTETLTRLVRARERERSLR